MFQSASVVTSIVSLAWALTTYNRSLRFAQVDKENIHLLGTCILFFAHLFGICKLHSISLSDYFQSLIFITFFRCQSYCPERLCHRILLAYLGCYFGSLGLDGHLALVTKDSRMFQPHRRVLFLPYSSHHPHLHLFQCKTRPHAVPLRVLLHGMYFSSIFHLEV